MNYEFEIKDIEPMTVATMHYKGLVTEAAKNFPAVFKAIKGKANGAPFLYYHYIDQETGTGDMELCVPTAVTPKGNGIVLKNLPRGKVLCLTHVGPYNSLPRAYQALHQYIQLNDLSAHPPWREVYIKGPGMIIKGNPHKYITEILFPLQERF